MSGVFGVPTKIAVLGGRSEIAAAIVEAIAARGGSIKAVRCVRGATDGEIEYDASDASSASRALASAAEQMNGIDCVIVAAGVLGTAAETLDDAAAAWWHSTVNYTGAVAGGVAAAACLAEHGGGVVVYLGSVAGVRVRRVMSLYGSAKHGADAFYRSAAATWADRGVDTVVVRPGFVHTAMTRSAPVAPFAIMPKAVGASVVAALMSGRSVVYVPGILRIVAAVMRAVPERMWRNIRR